jgi:hypothetical protein
MKTLEPPPQQIRDEEQGRTLELSGPDVKLLQTGKMLGNR